MAKPVIKWVGGKTQLLKELKEIITPELLEGHTYYEPFIGGGALAFGMEHNPTVINDMNYELVNLYNIIKQRPEELIKLLKQMQANHSEEYYYSIRAWDRNPNAAMFSNPVVMAARTIYLNKTCFNGLFRVNSKGYFNSPIGRTSSGKMPTICDEEAIMDLHNFLKFVMIKHGDYRDACCMANPGDTVYLDPPYDYEDDNGFVAYQKEGWTRQSLTDLKIFCDRLISKGVNVVISNNDTTFVRELFTGYEIKEVSAKRNINCKGNNRNSGKEVIIYKINK